MDNLSRYGRGQRSESDMCREKGVQTWLLREHMYDLDLSLLYITWQTVHKVACSFTFPPSFVFPSLWCCFWQFRSPMINVNLRCWHKKRAGWDPFKHITGTEKHSDTEPSFLTLEGKLTKQRSNVPKVVLVCLYVVWAHGKVSVYMMGSCEIPSYWSWGPRFPAAVF